MMLNSSLCGYSDAYILVSETIAISNTGAVATPNNSKNIIIKNCTLYTDCISEINNAQIDNAIDTDVVMPMYNLIEYSNNYSKTSGSLWQYHRDEPFLDSNGAIADIPADNNNSASFTFKTRYVARDVKIMVPLKYLSNFWRTLKIPLINCEINLVLT